MFKEFNLATANIRRVRSNSQDEGKQTTEAETHVFHAQPMPDFNKLKPKTCGKRDLPQLTKPLAPSFTTDARGEDKKARLMQKVADERRAALEATRFKAREFKPSEMRAASLGGGSGKTTPSAALMAVVKEFKLHSLLRC